jgi:hypothetical protein
LGTFIDLTGKIFGKLTVLERCGYTGKNHITWQCQCECGNKKIICGTELRSGDTKSCGCLLYKKTSIEEKDNHTIKVLKENVKKNEKTGCFEWNMGLNHNGYGSVNYRGKTKLAHRVNWILNKGEIPKGMHVLHKCDNPRCICLDHLFLGSHADNMHDMAKKQRHGKNNHKGQNHYRTKFTDEQIYDIRKKYKEGIKPYEIAKLYNSSYYSIYFVVTRRSWKHLDDKK